MINAKWPKWQETQDGFVLWTGSVQAVVKHLAGRWIWQVGHEDIEARGETPNGPEALEAAERAVAKMMEAERGTNVN